MTERDMSAQNVVLIRSAEDPATWVNWGGTGLYPPPLGTVKTGTQTPTLDNSTTPANNTPGEPSFEIVKGKASLSFTNDDDDKEASDVTTREIEHDPGKEMNEIALEHWETLGESRYGNARCFHPTLIKYLPANKYPRYEALVISNPLDAVVATGQPIYVDDALLKSAILAAKHIWYIRDLIFKTKNPTLASGEKVQQTLNGNYITKDEYLSYDFGAELLVATAMTTGNYSLVTQPKIPTRLQLVVTSWVAADDLAIVGTNCRGEAITETIAAATLVADGTYYTDNVFATVDTNGLQCAALFDMTVEVNADELY